MLNDGYMHVDVVPNRNFSPCVLIRESYREEGKIRHRKLANISDLSSDRIMAIKRALRGGFDEVASSATQGGSSRVRNSGPVCAVPDRAGDGTAGSFREGEKGKTSPLDGSCPGNPSHGQESRGWMGPQSGGLWAARSRGPGGDGL